MFNLQNRSDFKEKKWNIKVKEPSIVNLCDRNFKEISKHIQGKDAPFIQMGSYSCANYFIHAIKFIAGSDLEVFALNRFDLVIPTLPEHYLNILESEEFDRCCDRCRQIVVNDFGMLQYFNNRYDIRLGRLFFKDYRDRRYEEYDLAEYKGKTNPVLNFVFNSKFQIKGYENDIITQNYNYDYNKALEVYLHYPYRQISMCHICEYASIGKKIEDKYIPDDFCNMQCFDVKIISPEYKYIKVGKSVYDILDERYLESIKNDYCLIITPEW